jgi:hypothetical protein
MNVITTDGLYATDRSWSDRYIPAICAAIGPHLMKVASVKADLKKAADLTLLYARDVTIATRMRRHGYLERYPHHFTIRAIRDNGAPTELDKYIAGWGDLMFYGHAAEGAEPVLAAWMLLRLNALRAIWIRHPEILQQDEGEGWGWMKWFPDGTRSRWFDLRFLVRDCPELLVASYQLGLDPPVTP